MGGMKRRPVVPTVIQTAIALTLFCLAASAQQKRLILHADDLGNAHATNVAAMEMLDSGAVSSASIMMPCAWVAEIADYARKHPEKDLGLHLTLTSEWKGLRWGPVAGREKVPGLVDPEGYMHKSEVTVAMKATPQEIETELRAQIQLAQKLGIKFTHFDTHMGTLYTRLEFFQVFEKLGKEYGVPILRVKPSDAARQRLKAVPDLIKYVTDNEPRFAQEGLPRLDLLVESAAGGAKTFDDRKAAYWKTLRELPPGQTMMIIHPAVLDPELKAMTNSAADRDGDYRIFMDAATRQVIRDAEIKLIGWRDAK
jgi:chitin disaccharide deacetylase